MSSTDTDAPITLQLLKVIIERSRDNIAIADQEGRLLEISPGLPSIYGGEARDFVGHTVFELEQRGVFRPSVTALVLRQGGEAQVLQKTLLGRTVMAQAFPVRDQSGRIERIVSFSYDMTDLQLLREEYERLQQSLLGSPDAEAAATEIDGVSYPSAAIRTVHNLIGRVSATDANVLLLGETGVGKTQFARLLHRLSHRHSHRLVELSCAALPESLIEAELFGYEAGAFTGAQAHGKPGLLEEATRGTLFLDEIGEAPLALQAKLLKVLQDRRIIRIGGVRERPVDFRLIAATNKDLKALVEQGQFRLDLYYRLNVFPITIPPLRLRREDLPVLIRHTLERLAERYRVTKTLHSSVYERLLAYHWPGNIRELENTLERLLVASAGSVIRAEGDLLEMLPPAVVRSNAAGAPPATGELPLEPLPQALARVERELLQAARARCRSTYEIAEALGISQPSVVRKLKEYGL